MVRFKGSLSQWLQYISTQHDKEIALGLDRSIEVAQRLGVLPLAPRQLIVAGTNGKGSTVRFSESLLLAQGYKVGAVLSPHLHRYNERVRLNGSEASDDLLVAGFEAVEAARGDIPLTYYEYSVLGAFWVFKQAGLDACLLEVGLGGRLDTTNIIDADVAAVTSIGLDHQNFLGDTLELIGAEKAAVCRPGRPLLLGGQMPESVYRVAEASGAVTERFGWDFWYQRTAQSAVLRLNGGDLSVPAPGEPGIAWRNAVLACACVQKLTRVPSPEEFRRACEITFHPGRFEVFNHRHRTLVVDVAHNPDSARFLRSQLRARWPNNRLVAVCGFLGDKDVAGIVCELVEDIDHWLFVSTKGSRGLAAEEAAERSKAGLISGRTGPEVSQVVMPDVDRALQKAHAVTDKADIIVAFGSFMHVEQVRELLLTPDRSPPDLMVAERMNE